MYQPLKPRDEHVVKASWWGLGKKEVYTLIKSAGLLWGVCALATFHAGDASWFHYVTPAMPYMNWCGALGAHLAALAFVFLGGAAWVLLCGTAFVIASDLFDSAAMHSATRISALAVLTSSSAGFLQITGISLFAPFPGGIVGRMCAALTSLTGGLGGVLILGSVALCSGLIVTQKSLADCVVVAWKAVAALRMGLRMALGIASRIFWTNSDWLWYRGRAAQEAANVLDAERESVQLEERVSEQGTHAYEDFQPEEVQGVYASTEVDMLNEDEVAHAVSGQDIDEMDELDDDKDAFSFEAQDEDSFPEVSASEDDEFVSDDADDAFHFDDDIQDDETEVVAESDDETFSFVSDDDDMSDDYDVYDDDQEYEEEHDDSDESGGYSLGAKLAGLSASSQQDEEELNFDRQEEEPEQAPSYSAPEPFELPELDMFGDVDGGGGADEAFMAACEERGRLLEEKLAHFGITGQVTAIRPGPVITVFEYQPEIGSKVSRILALEDDLAMSLRAYSIRIIAPVPGKNVVGFEIANEDRSFVSFASVVRRGGLQDKTRKLPITLGVDTVGTPVISDLASMPHLLVAGATGSGKSVGMNVMLVSLLSSLTPDDVRFILIDPKRLEFAPYADIPHLLFPIVTNPHEVAPVLKWVVQEMEMRYEVLAQAGVRNIGDYRKLDPQVRFEIEESVGCTVKGMPYIVLMVDELADLMMVAGKEIEVQIARIAQMARAAGIHMIVATQRPSVDVVTGIIKVNFPSRIAFRVSSKVDSRTIVDAMGAEKLLGKGDMLFMSPASPVLQRLHGPFVADEQINELTEWLKIQRDVSYLSLQQIIAKHGDKAQDDDDELYPEIRDFLTTVDEVSISMLQRKFRVGFNRSARIIEMLERDGYIAPAQGSKPRRVLKH